LQSTFDARTIERMKEPYKSKGRSWIKLWVPEWLDGTTRYEMSGAQRAFWVDLLTMAGRSRVPGVVCAGDNKGKLFGYPLSRYTGILNDPSVDILETFKLFESQDKIQVIVTKEDEPRYYAVKILSWSKYQSEYMRQRETRMQGARQNTPRCSVEGEVEGEVEVEKKRQTLAAKSAADFESFWNAYPKKVGKKETRRAWLKIVGVHNHVAEIISGVEKWKMNPQWENAQYIPNPATFLNQRRWEDEVPNKTTERSNERLASVKRIIEKGKQYGIR
jgi:hypothetical protein